MIALRPLRDRFSGLSVAATLEPYATDGSNKRGETDHAEAQRTQRRRAMS